MASWLYGFKLMQNLELNHMATAQTTNHGPVQENQDKMETSFIRRSAVASCQPKHPMS